MPKDNMAGQPHLLPKLQNSKLYTVLVAYVVIGIITGVTGNSTKIPKPTLRIQKHEAINVTDSFPEYWKDFRDFTHITNSFRSFWLKYAWCGENPWDSQCTQYNYARGHNWHFKTYMSSMDYNVTDMEEENPLKCHWIEVWAHKTQHMAIYASSVKTYADLKRITLKVNGKYRTMAINYTDFWEDTKIGVGTFTCAMVLNWTLPRSIFYPFTYDEDRYIGYQYNETTGAVEEQDYDYGEEMIEEETEDNTTQTTQTTTSLATTTPLLDKPKLKKMGKMQPRWITQGILDLPKPWGNKCPINYTNTLNLTKPYNLLCVAEFPNLPYFGEIIPVDKNGNTLEGAPMINHSRPDIWSQNWWDKILPLGVEYWSYPIALTDVYTQPHAATRREHILPKNWDHCNWPTHQCFLSNVVEHERELGESIWLCIPYNMQNTKKNYTHTNGGNKTDKFQYYTWHRKIPGENNYYVYSKEGLRTHKVVWITNSTWIQNYTNSNYSGKGFTAYKISFNQTQVQYSFPEETITLPVYCKNYTKTGCGRKQSDKQKSDPQKPPPPTIICAEHKITTHYPIPYDIDYFKGNYSRDPKNTTTGQTTQKVFIKDIFLNITYVQPVVHDGVQVMFYEHSYGDRYEPLRWANSSFAAKVKYSTFDKAMPLDDLYNLGMKPQKTIRYRHEGYPYYFPFWTMNPRWDQWEEVTWIAHTPTGENGTRTASRNMVLHVPLTHTSFPGFKEHEGKLVKRGTLNGTKPVNFYTAHFPMGYLNPPGGQPAARKAPMVVPDLKVPAKIILKPRIRKVQLKIDLTSLEPPQQYCQGNIDITYDAPIAVGRKPLQLLAAAILAGGLIGGILGGGVAAAELVPIKAEITHIQMLNKKTSEAIAAVSNSLDAINILQQQMRAEMKLIEDRFDEPEKLRRQIMENEHNKMMCIQYRMARDRVIQELNVLFMTGRGRRTPEFLTIQDPQAESSCSASMCIFNLYQIFLDNAQAGYHTRAIPQKLDRRESPFQKTYWNWVTPIDNFLYMDVKGNPAYIPIDDCYKIEDNTFVYPHLPLERMEETRLTLTTMPYTLQDMGQWTFLHCHDRPTNITCTNLNEEQMIDEVFELTVEEGCWIIHNCSIVTSENTTLVTEIGLPRYHIFSAPTKFIESLEQEHWDEFARQIQKIQDIADHNQKQLDSIHKKMQATELNIIHRQAEVHNLVGLLRTNTYVHKDWNKKLTKCGLWDYAARLFRFDFTCTPLRGWWQWIKEVTYWLSIGILVFIVLQIILRFYQAKKYGKIRKKYAEPKWKEV